MIRFGPAGIPLSCKGRTLREGIADLHQLGLSAMEVQYIKVNVGRRPVLDEEVGQTPRTLSQTLVVAVERGGDDAGATPKAELLSRPLQKGDRLTTVQWGLAREYADLTQMRDLARSLDVQLTVHAPYYVDFFSSEDARQRSIHQIQWAGVLAEGLGARYLVTHLGFYHPSGRAETLPLLRQTLRELAQWAERYARGALRLAIEPSGHPDVLGSREEVLELARSVPNVQPVLNLPHLAARETRRFETPGDLAGTVEEFLRAGGGELYAHFAGLEWFGPGEFQFTPIKRGSLRFDPLAEVLADRSYDATVISGSPLLEHDAMYMKLLYERALARRFLRRRPAAPERAPSPPPARHAPKHGPARGGARPPPRPRAKPRPKRSHRRPEKRHAGSARRR